MESGGFRLSKFTLARDRKNGGKPPFLISSDQAFNPAHGFVEARASLACSAGDGKRSTRHIPGADVHVVTDLPRERLSPVVPAPDRTKQSTNMDALWNSSFCG